MCKTASKSSLSDDTGVRVKEVSDDESYSIDDGLECPICCEPFNMMKNVPYVLWCGHSLCKNCILSLPWTVMKINSSSVKLPPLITCPWCHLLSPRIVLKGHLKFPHKNYFLLGMVERFKSDQQVSKSHNVDSCVDFQPSKVVEKSQTTHSNVQRLQRFHHTTNQYRQSNVLRSLFIFIELISKFPLVLIFLLLLLFAIPASIVNLAVYSVLTVVFALPSFLILYFSYPSLDWLAREIMA